MKDISGIWEGECSINTGNEENPKIDYVTFHLEISDTEGELKGAVKDISLSNETSEISGFHEDNYISFIKKYSRLIYYDKNGDYYSDDSENHPDIHYYGTFNETENCFEGTWEIKISEQKIGLQSDFLTDMKTGKWYMRLTQKGN